LRLEQRALDAWADQRLIVVKLDKGIAPVGLRDLPAIDASFEAQREFKWQEVATAVRETLARPPALPKENEDVEAPPPPAAKKRGGLLGGVALLLIALPGVGAAAVATAIWLVNRIGPTPGTFEDLRHGVDEFGLRYGAPAGVTEWLFVAAMATTIVALSFFVARLTAPRDRAVKREETALSRVETLEPTQTETLFVSYASANAKDVLPMIEGAKTPGRSFWIDQKGISAGKSWAGEIVRAIRTAGGVVVMCSKAAFESDHVKREIYLADRYRKKLTPVFIEQAEPPEDFEYFFAGVQQLKLFETPEAERQQALLSALGATP
jgi:hypothetical protein